ncbi:MAG TPA: phosphate ABC transporter permease subunit PstC [Arachnia sp.]|nr:phosphate ABC transporter permease subunit PstC [Arachnia sp.]HMT87644.1 phosphate ABC transporter permease subunit PstC [Arachnia sp.]
MPTDTTERRLRSSDEAAPNAELVRDKRRYGDVLFRRLSTGSGSLILIILAAVAVFLLGLAAPALFASAEDLPFGPFWSWVLPLAAGTVWAAFLAMLFAVPIAIGVALFISHYAPRRLAQGLGYIIDLLAAVPSVVFGLWGITVFAPMMLPIYTWLNKTFGDVPVLSYFFGGQVSGTGRTILTAAMVLAVMVLPIVTAISREVFLQTPRLHEEASLALGATRWEMIRQAVLPFATPGIISACMLGLGRALGETMAVAMVLSPAPGFHLRLLTSSNPNSIAANIALQFPEAYDLGINQLIASGLILFVITLAVNMGARAIIARRAEFSGAN